MTSNLRLYPDPADLFVELYDNLPEELFRSDRVEGWLRDKEFRDAVEDVTQALEEDGTLGAGDIAWLLDWPDHKGELAVAIGIDEALVPANPFHSAVLPPDSPLIEVVHRYVKSGRLNNETPGLLLPRRTYPGRVLSGKEKREFFKVVRVSERTQNRGYSNSFTMSATDPIFAPGQPVLVGFVPVLTSYTDLEWTFPVRHGRVRYRLAPKAAVRDRLESVLDALDDSGVDIGVLPEVSLSDDLLAAWIGLLKKKRPPGRHARLRWILLGSGPVQEGVNRAVLVDRRTGRTLLIQDKLADFSLTRFHFDRWRLPRPGEGWDGESEVLEDIPREVPFRSVDTFVGRIGVLICESISRWPDTWNDVITESGISHVFAPVFSKPIARRGWETESSGQLMNRIGAWTMVANSLAIGRSMERVAGQPETDEYSFAVVGPFDRLRRSYRTHQQYGVSGDAHEVATLGFDETDKDAHPDLPDLPGRSGPWPWVRAAELRDDWFPERRDL